MKKDSNGNNFNCSEKGVIEIPLKGSFPLKVKITDGPKVHDTYSLVKTKSERFMLQK